MKKRTLVSWSSGKDSAWALHVLRRQAELDVVGLFCTFNKAFERVSMHGVRVELVRQQARSTGLPLELIPIPHPCTDADYASLMMRFVEQAEAQGIDCFAFGDLFLEDVRRYREERLTGTGITPLFPLWGTPTKQSSQDMVSGGLRAVVTCVDPERLPAKFAGRRYDRGFLAELPSDVDPCGEHGEFHTFAFDGPMFTRTIDLAVGDSVSREGLLFTDLLPAGHPMAHP